MFHTVYRLAPRQLTERKKAALRRQQTLRATIEWSYELLDADEQQLFAQLAESAAAEELRRVWDTLPR